ncbi:MULTISPECIES: ABC transporter ATP-binding protein [unclassified Nocardioides]|jgi:iron complex transport system ATP-binding protein|uniref:ABC transporter ATP-binding protein n=1 Tax=unclassified Nocardioides TaxID=2615069 RepID=UPI0011545BAB|nr:MULTISPECIES: ATP-binding cassette domain-containing protein [unclassified Nocardioides]TQK70088.1 iron complex transport system ATP-binding protein [Nocardioides sp. SLBN-35]WGY00679.1 ATP-binding cassette domain-containing protein [Nocardioides sp. QY071]
MSSTVLDLTDVVFRRGGSEILHGVDLTVRAGEHWALLGPNGAGKSTLLGFCSAQVHPTSGTVDVLGKRLGRVELQELRRHIGHVNPRHPLQTALTVHQVVLTGITGTVELPMRWAPTDEQARTADELIAEVGLAHRRDARWPHLSQGERGRALIARALLAQPQLLLLDEPTTGLDVAAREQLLTVLDRLAHTAPEVASVLVTHHLEELPTTTTHALLLAHGQVVAAGPVAETVTTETITRTFEHPIEVDHDGGRWRARALPPARLHSA